MRQTRRATERPHLNERHRSFNPRRLWNPPRDLLPLVRSASAATRPGRRTGSGGSQVVKLFVLDSSGTISHI